MSWLDYTSTWLSEHRTLIWCVSAGSLVLFLVTPILVAWLVTTLPVDYFSQKHRRALATWDGKPAIRLLLLIAKSTLGILLLIAGVAMLVAPGQGVLTIIAGLILLEFPGKFRAERWLVTRRHVWRSINWLRKRAGKPELKSPRQ